MHVQLTFMLFGRIDLWFNFPRIFFVSICTFSSSFGIYGITLSMISRAMTPGDRPAPDKACNDVINTLFTPYLSMIGFKVMARPVVVQFGSGAINPAQFLFFF